MLLLKYSLDYASDREVHDQTLVLVGSLSYLATTTREFGGRQWWEIGRKWQHHLLSHRELSRGPSTVCLKPGSHTIDQTPSNHLYDGKNNRNDFISMIRSH